MKFSKDSVAEDGSHWAGGVLVCARSGAELAIAIGSGRQASEVRTSISAVALLIKPAHISSHYI